MGASLVVTHAILTIASVIMASILAAVTLHKVSELCNVVSQVGKQESLRFLRSIKVVYAAVINNSNVANAVVYVKNVGNVPIEIEELKDADVYFGRYGHANYYLWGGGPVGWDFEEFDNDQLWRPGETIKINVYSEEAYIRAVYYFKIVLIDGTSAEEVIAP